MKHSNSKDRNQTVGSGIDNSGNAANHRLTRVEADMRQTIAQYLSVAFRGELPGLVSLTRVIVSRDLRQAKVLFTVMALSQEIAPSAVGPSSPSFSLSSPLLSLSSPSLSLSSPLLNKETLNFLQSHAAEIQAEVNRRLRMKFCPKLTFFHDNGFEDAMRIEGILNDISKQRAGES